MLMRRYAAVEKAKDADVIGILVGTLGVGSSFFLFAFPFTLRHLLLDVSNVTRLFPYSSLTSPFFFTLFLQPFLPLFPYFPR
jgi:hypothetical protein